MQIRVSTGNCRLAVAAAIVATEAKLKEYRQKLWEQTHETLVAGAVHNGVVMNDALKAEMRDMVDRDVDVAMRRRQENEELEVLQNFTDMLNYHGGDTIDIDDRDFHLLKAHLPKNNLAKAEEAAIAYEEQYGT